MQISKFTKAYEMIQDINGKQKTALKWYYNLTIVV